MFGFKKKQETLVTAYDTIYLDKWWAMQDAFNDLQESVEEVIVTTGIISLYPEGAEKEKTKKNADFEKSVLLCTIAKYDRLYDELVNYYLENKENLCKTTDFKPCQWETSYKCIEKVYRNFFKKHVDKSLKV